MRFDRREVGRGERSYSFSNPVLKMAVERLILPLKDFCLTGDFPFEAEREKLTRMRR